MVEFTCSDLSEMQSTRKSNLRNEQRLKHTILRKICGPKKDEDHKQFIILGLHSHEFSDLYKSASMYIVEKTGWLPSLWLR
jgi:hypothetical protein